MKQERPTRPAESQGCPVNLEQVDLFGPGCQEHWYQAYPILHEHAPVLVLHGEGLNGAGDAFVLSRYEDIERVVKAPARFTPLMSLMVQDLQATIDRGEQPQADTSRFDLALDSVRTLRPDEILWRRKTGMGVPTAAWLNWSLRSLVKHFLNERSLYDRGLFNPDYVKSLFSRRMPEHEIRYRR